MELLQNDAVIALLGMILGAPFLNFIINLFKARADNNSVVATGASTAVTAMQTSIENLRIDLIDARKELDAARDEMDTMRIQHVRELADVKSEHRTELQNSRAEARELRERVYRLEQTLQSMHERTVE